MKEMNKMFNEHYISFTPPFLGELSPRKLHTGKKNCVREMTVEVRFFSGHPGCYLGNSRDFPYNRNDAILIPFLLSRLLAPPRGGKLLDCLILVCP